MKPQNQKLLLVGDNPFHGISHLSQERARCRTGTADSVAEKADVVLTAIKNGANGFMFSVSEVTLSILKNIRDQNEMGSIKLYAIVPYPFEYVRIATQIGTPGLAKRLVKQVLTSGDVCVILSGIRALATVDINRLLKTYLAYEISRIQSSAGKKADLTSILLSEIVTDMGLALNFEWLFKSYISYLSKKGIIPGFNSRNLPFIVKRFEEWDINLDEIVLATPFNKAGFQMNPSREECERTLANLRTPIVLAISVLAAGYFRPSEAVDYIASLRNLKGVVAGASKKQQAGELFKLFNARLAIQ